jgi:hypothetical protein
MPTRQDVRQGGHMIKIPLTVAVLVSVGSFAGLATAQDKQGEALSREISSQCAHRRVMGPDPHDDCVRKLRSDPQLGYGGRLRYGQGRPGYGQGQPGYGQGQLSYGQDQLGYRQDQFGDVQGAASAISPDQRDEEQLTIRREQPRPSAPPKVAAPHAPKAKKANPQPRLAAQHQKEQQLYQEFLEWRNRRLFNEYQP